MQESSLPRILTIKEVAEYFRIREETVLREIEEGGLRGFRIGNEWRLTEEQLAEFINRNHRSLSRGRENRPSVQYEITDFTQIGPFDYRWPKSEDHFEEGYETMRAINGREHTFRIGCTSREAAGRVRRKIVVWVNNWPVVEFTGGNEYESDGLLAGIIKTPKGKQLHPSDKVPEEYRSFRVDRYDSIVQGRYASRNMAVIVDKDDLESMIRHAIIRATWKRLI